MPLALPNYHFEDKNRTAGEQVIVHVPDEVVHGNIVGW